MIANESALRDCRDKNGVSVRIGDIVAYTGYSQVPRYARITGVKDEWILGVYDNGLDELSKLKSTWRNNVVTVNDMKYCTIVNKYNEWMFKK